MKNSILTIVIVLFFITINSCGVIDNKVSKVQEFLQQKVNDESQGTLKVVSLKKTNGYDKEFGGMNYYVIEWNAVISAQREIWTAEINADYIESFKVTLTEPPAFNGHGWFSQRFPPIHLGTNAQIQMSGIASLHKTEQGWNVEEYKVTKHEILNQGFDNTKQKSVGSSTGDNTISNTDKMNLASRIDSVSFALGIVVGENYKKQLFGGSAGKKVNIELLSKGFRMALLEEKNIMKIDVANKIVTTYFEGANKNEATKNLEEGSLFLKQNKLRPNIITTGSGLQYEVLATGNGAKPSKNDKVRVNYRGTLIDGTVFDSSFDRGEPVTFPVNQVIPGWIEALQLMSVGSKWKIYVPANLGYGERGAGNIIGPNSVLIFEVELLDVIK